MTSPAAGRAELTAGQLVLLGESAEDVVAEGGLQQSHGASTGKGVVPEFLDPVGAEAETMFSPTREVLSLNQVSRDVRRHAFQHDPADGAPSDFWRSSRP